MIEMPVMYKSNFKISELEKVKLEQSFDDGTKVKVEVPLFTGQQGLEGLVYIVDRFKDACKTLDWVEGTEMFEGFTKVLQGQAYTYWIDEVLKEFSNEDHQTLESFEEAVNMMKISFGGGTMARNHILQYIQSNDCKKPRKSTVEEHVRRIVTLISLANQSTGTDAKVTKIKTNELLLSTMPNQWQQNFKLSGHTIADMTTDKFITYFSEVKSVYDSEQPIVRGTTQGRGPRSLGQRGGRMGQIWNRGGGRFSFNGRSGRGRGFNNNWRRNNGFRYNFNNFYRGGYGNNYQRNGANSRNQFGYHRGRGFNRSGRNTNGRFNDNRQQSNNNHQNYWNEYNEWQQNGNSMNNSNYGNGEDTNTQENRIVEVNHWETVNNTNNREEWDRTRYRYNPSGR